MAKAMPTLPPDGEKIAVLDGAGADAFIVVARTAGEDDDPQGISLFLLPASYLILEDLRLWARGPLPRPLEVVVTADRKAEPGAGIARVGAPRR